MTAPAHRARLVACALALVLPGSAVACSVVGAGAAAAAQHGRRPSPRLAGAKGSCPTAGGLAFTGTLSNGALDLGRAVSGSGLAGSVCGLLSPTSSGFSVSIPKADISFAPNHVTVLGLASLPVTVAAAGNGTGTASIRAGGSFGVTISVPVTATVDIFGFACTVGPFRPALTTGKSGAVSGTPLTGSLSDLSGTLAAGEFAVPRVRASARCPFFVAWLVNAITGLPLRAGRATLTAATALSVG